MKRWLALSVMLAAVAGCTVGPPYQRPDVEVPPQYFRSTDAAPASFADIAWWKAFDDPVLAALVREALRDNLDLRIAAAQIEEARAQVAAARSPIFPQASGQVSGSRSNNNPGFFTENSFGAALLLAWEIDLWGRYRSATEAARAQLLATEAGRNGIIASLVTGVVAQYLTLAGLRERLEIVRQTAVTQRNSLQLVTLLAQSGVQSAVEVRQAQTQLLATESQIPAIELSIARNEDALATLLGKPPRAFDVSAALPPRAVPPAVPPGLPSALIERRPDIRQAESALVAANANIGVARAQFFPTLSLTGSLGRASDVLVGFVTRRGVTTHSVDAAIGVPIFQGGALVANYDIARARAQQATEQYRRTILVALQEVSDALAAYDRNGAQARDNRERVAVAQDYLMLANLRFRAGVISYLEVLDAERQLFAAQLDLNTSATNQRLDAVQLYRALGGGWRDEESESIAAGAAR
jgi:multidrug efflux system outer membrane protein